MSTEVTPESLRTHATWLDAHCMPVEAAALRCEADHPEHLQRPLPTEPGWYPGIVVERGGESCTGALLTDDEGWITARPVLGCHHHYVGGISVVTIRWAEQDGKTPGQTLWEAEPNRGVAWSSVGQTVKALYERIAAAVLAARGTPTLIPVGEHPKPGTRGLLPVVVDVGTACGWVNVRGRRYACDRVSGVAETILADPRPDGARE